MYKYFLCLRYLRRRRIAFFAVAAVCLCVAMVLIVVSVMGGFLQMVKDRSRGMLGDLVVENQSLQGFPYYNDFIGRVKKELAADIYEATPVIITYGVLRFPVDQITKPVQIVGIRLDETYRVNDFKSGLFYEKYYPGTTTLAPQKEPHFGLDETGNYILPPELEEAYKQFIANSTPQQRAKTPIDKRMPYERPGYYGPISTQPSPESFGPAFEGPALPGVIIGTDICAKRLRTGDYQRYYDRGNRIQLTFVPITHTGTVDDNTGMPSKVFRYTDDSRTGVYDIDSMSVYVDFDFLQRVLSMDEVELKDSPGARAPARATQVQMKLTPGKNSEAVLRVRDAVQAIWNEIARAHMHEVRSPELLRRVEVKTWEQKQEKFIAAVEKEKILVTTLFGVVSVVAVLLVGCIFYMIVQQKTRDIGIIKSVGATSMGVAGIFLIYGAAVGVVGGALGTGIGVLFVKYINEVQDVLAWISPGAVIWNPEVYTFDRIPSQVSFSDGFTIYLIAILASMIGALMAAVRAARVWPVEALRYE